MIPFLSFVEITEFRLESKSCKGFFLQINFPPMKALKFFKLVIFKLRYDQIYQMKTNHMGLEFWLAKESIPVDSKFLSILDKEKQKLC